MKLSTKEIEKKIRTLLLEKVVDIKTKEIKLESKLKEDLGVDSFGSVELAFAIKDEFGIEIPNEDLGKIKKVQDVVDYISIRINKE